jgi:geranylgeranyl pyrophosphate synthase
MARGLLQRLLLRAATVGAGSHPLPCLLAGVRALRNGSVSDKEAFLAMAMGWCIEWLQAFFLVADDMMDHSITRRGQPCWYKLPHVGLNACNDCIVLEACIYKILKKHARHLPCYTEVRLCVVLFTAPIAWL